MYIYLYIYIYIYIYYTYQNASTPHRIPAAQTRRKGSPDRLTTSKKGPRPEISGGRPLRPSLEMAVTIKMSWHTGGGFGWGSNRQRCPVRRSDSTSSFLLSKQRNPPVDPNHLSSGSSKGRMFGWGELGLTGRGRMRMNTATIRFCTLPLKKIPWSQFSGAFLNSIAFLLAL